MCVCALSTYIYAFLLSEMFFAFSQAPHLPKKKLNSVNGSQ